MIVKLHHIALSVVMTFVVYVHDVQAAAGDGGGDSILSWACASLDPKPGFPGARQSFCKVWSPSGALGTIEVSAHIYGQAGLNIDCEQSGFYEDYEYDEREYGDAAGHVVNAGWDYPVHTWSYADAIQGGVLWEYYSYVPPAPSGGSAIRPADGGWYINFYGPCW